MITIGVNVMGPYMLVKNSTSVLCVKNYTCEHFCKDLFVCFITDLGGIMEMEIKPAYIHNQIKPHVVAFRPVSGSEGHSQSV